MKQYNYIPHTCEDRQEMLQAIGVNSQNDLFTNIPEALRDINLIIPEALSELELNNRILELAQKNKWQGEYVSFLGAGCYDRYVPAAVDYIASRAEYLTAYTPYQPEISQGTLQAIYEYQTMICNLTGMDISNASMYDGSTAAAEAILMACRVTKKSNALISRAIDPETQLVIKTYIEGANIKSNVVDIEEGITNLQALKNSISDDIACVIIQMPNFLGNLEEVKKIEQITHEHKALFVVIAEPISLGLLKSPGHYGADIVVGNGQSLGNQMMFGGPGFGFLACKEKYMRQIPGRVIGSTVDNRGNTAYTLTLQTREQHIRRDKATSNICTNNSLNALSATIHLSLLGPQGIKELSNICFQRAHYLANKINEIQGFKVAYENFFNEFVLIIPEEINEDEFMKDMLDLKILAGLSIGKYYNEIPNSILVSVTEKNTPVELYLYINALKEISSNLFIEV